MQVLFSTRTKGVKPSSRVQEFYDIIITRENIAEQYKKQG